jgi:hypothetical protein
MAPRARPAKTRPAASKSKASPKKAETVASVTQSFASHVSGTIVTVKQGSSITTTSEQLDLFQGLVGLARTHEAKFAAAQAGVVLAGGTVSMDQSGAGVLTTQNSVSMEKSGALLLCANEVHANNSGAVFLLARKVGGSVKALFGPREALMVGAAAGVAAGLIIALGRMISGNRRRK